MRSLPPGWLARFENASLEELLNGDTISRSHRWSRSLLPYVLLALAYGGTGAIGSFLLRGVDNHLWSIAPYLAVPWLPAGIGVAGLLVGGVRLWSAIFAASVAIWVGIVRLPWLVGLVDSAAITLAYVVTVRLMGRWGFRRQFDRYEDPLLLIGAAAVGILIVEAVDLLSVPLTAALFPDSISPDLRTLIQPTPAGIMVPTPLFLGTALRWWLNDVAGVVLVVPAVASLSPELRRVLTVRPIEFIFWILSAALCVILIHNLAVGEARPLFLVAGLVIVVWAAVRFGVTSASLGTLLCSILASSAFLGHRGPFAEMNPSEGLAALWGFICILTAIGLFLSALLAERERVTGELRRSEERLNNALKVSQIGIFDYDHSTDRFFWSPELRRIFGFSSDEPVTYGRFLECVVPEDRRIIADSQPRARDPAGPNHEGIEYRITRRDGKVRWLLVHVESYESGTGAERRPHRTVGAALDITDRRMVEDSLRASQRRLAEAQRLGSMGSWDFDWDTHGFLLSEEAANILETQTIPLPGSDDPYLHFVHPDDRALIRSSVRNALERCETKSELTHRVCTPDGRVKFVTERWETAFAPNGSPLRMSGTVQDITERRRLEAAIIEAAFLERRRLASELHDNLGQVLFSTALMHGAFINEAVARNPELREPGEAIKGWLGDALEICRRLAHSAEPVVQGGLGEALRNLAMRNTNLLVHCEARIAVSAVEAITPSQALEFFRIAQEAITNALKHSHCTRIGIRLRSQRSIVELMIEDDGIGLATLGDRGSDGLGMRTMRYHAERAGGTLTLAAGRGGGTVVRALVPRRTDPQAPR